MKRLGNHSQRGAVLVFMALMLPIVVFFSGMAIDFGRAYLHKSQLQNAADAAALAGVSAAARSSSAHLVDTIPSGFLSTGETDKLIVAKDAANVILVKDVGTASANESNTKLRMTKEGNDPEVDADTYYYMVELTDEVKMVFAQLFLPQSLIPDDWNMKVAAKAWAKAKISKNIDLLTMLKEVEDKEVSATFRGWKKNVGGDFATAQTLSFTNNGIAYDYENKTRSEEFNMDNGDTERKDLFINFKSDISTTSVFEDNWDLSDLRGLSYDDISKFFYDTTGATKTPKVNIFRSNGKDKITLDQFIRDYAKEVDHITNLNDITNNNFNNYENVNKALEMLTSNVKDNINVNVGYQVRNVAGLPESEVSFVYNEDRRNYQDPLFVRIESEEFNDNSEGLKPNSGGVTESVRDIFINIKFDNTFKVNEKYQYRPLVFFYDGPVDMNGNRGQGRESNTVVVTLEEDFRGIIFAPNSAVQINGKGQELSEEHKFIGLIVAKRIIGPDGRDLTDEMPARQNKETDADLQAFYVKLGLYDSEYDDLDVVKLHDYARPKKDIMYLTNRASITT